MRWMGGRGALAVMGACWAVAVCAQDGRVSVFRDFGFAGPAVSFTRANPDLGRSVTVRSARVDGGKWELCERTRFRGPCVTLTESAASLARPEGWRGSMLSIRPLPLPEPPPATDERRRPGAATPPVEPAAPQVRPDPDPKG